jgi:hypothetical protein
MEFVLELSLLPVFLAFFITSLLAVFMKGEIGLSSDYVMLFMLLGAPLITFIIIPIQILLDSNLMVVTKDEKSGIIMLYLGAKFKGMMQNVLGVGSFLSYIGTFVVVGSGQEWTQIVMAIFVISLIIPVMLPSIFLVVCIYSLFHNRFVKNLNDALDKTVQKEYKIKQDKTDWHFIAMVPKKYESQTIEQVTRHLK